MNSDWWFHRIINSNNEAKLLFDKRQHLTWVAALWQAAVFNLALAKASCGWRRAFSFALLLKVPYVAHLPKFSNDNVCFLPVLCHSALGLSPPQQWKKFCFLANMWKVQQSNTFSGKLKLSISSGSSKPNVVFSQSIQFFLHNQVRPRWNRWWKTAGTFKGEILG